MFLSEELLEQIHQRAAQYDLKMRGQRKIMRH